MGFFLEVLVGGLLAGVMYTMVALGFVLIYKASGVFNIAQGAMVLFAALTFVTLLEHGVAFVAALVASLAVMLALAVAIERLVLRHLVNAPPMALFLATLGISFILEGTAQLAYGTQVHGLELGVSDAPIAGLPIAISRFDVFAAVVAGALVAALGVFFRTTRAGVGLRAIADDPLAAVAVGLDVPRLWTIAWGGAGVVALVAGLLWGARVGVQFSLSLVVLKALPVLVIGGFSSIGGVIASGAIVGASEKLAEVYVGSHVGGGIETWFPYAMAIGFLLLRPTGLFGRPVVARV
ncbi:MAG TPA: branched-chain amino acid ABC transporter permease [Polyangiaceae bacterium]|nr:branched-chain amino acid ABC transporter permease [Polyangiaceae bacterium]